MPGHMRILHPAPGIRAYYDGRVEGYRFADYPNWVDDGALSLGIASYALVEGDEAIVYDTHISVEHARFIRADLESVGVRKFRVVLSHHHLDHVAGTEAFADCEIIANNKTKAHLLRRKPAIEAGTLEKLPAISPLIMPNRLFDGEMTLDLGGRRIDMIELDIHSDDATVVWLPESRILLAGDTLEDTVTYVAEPQHLGRHLLDLDRLAALDPAFILPNHGDPDIIAAGGYSKALIAATKDYVGALMRVAHEPDRQALSLREFVAPQLESSAIHYFAPYEDVHRNNIATALAASSRTTA